MMAIWISNWLYPLDSLSLRDSWLDQMGCLHWKNIFAMKHLDCLPGTVIHCGVFTNWRPFEIICYYVAKGADKIPPPFHLGKTHFIMNSIPNICHFLHCFGVILPHYFGIISPWLSGRPTNHDGYQFWLIIPPKFMWVFLNRKNNNDILAYAHWKT